jgi:hypothetical protein
MVQRAFPPNQAIGGEPKKRGRRARFHSATPLRPPKQLAGGVKSPEKMQVFGRFVYALAEGVSWLDSLPSVVFHEIISSFRHFTHLNRRAFQ